MIEEIHQTDEIQIEKTLKNIENNTKLQDKKHISPPLITRKFSPKGDVILLKLIPNHHLLSAEQQIFFMKLTEGIFGYNEQIRNENLMILSTDYNVKYLLPYLSLFIKETIQVNIALTDLTLLIYTVRMTKSLLSNKHLNTKEYLHEILPAILSCALSKKISKYHSDNHWTLRDFSAYIVAEISQKYNTTLNDITSRVITIYQKPLKDHYYPLTSVYGAVKGLGCLGEEAIKNGLIPYVANISKLTQIIFEKTFPFYSEENSKQLVKEAKHVKDAIIAIISPILLKTKNVNDGGLLYVKHFGYLGRYIYAEVKNLERQEIEKQKFLMYGNRTVYCAQILSNIQNTIPNYNFFTENAMGSSNQKQNAENVNVA